MEEAPPETENPENEVGLLPLAEFANRLLIYTGFKKSLFVRSGQIEHSEGRECLPLFYAGDVGAGNIFKIVFNTKYLHRFSREEIGRFSKT